MEVKYRVKLASGTIVQQWMAVPEDTRNDEDAIYDAVYEYAQQKHEQSLRWLRIIEKA